MNRAQTHAGPRLLIGTMLVLALTACTAGAARTTSAPTRWVARVPLLQALPAKATFAWVLPGALIVDATSADDASTRTGAARSARLDVEALLLGEGWKVVAADTAQFEATIAILHRTTFETEVRTVPGTDPMPRRCDSTRLGGRCPTVPPPRTETRQVPVGEDRMILAVRRRADGAWRLWTSPQVATNESGGYFVKELIGLLRASAAR